MGRFAKALQESQNKNCKELQGYHRVHEKKRSGFLVEDRNSGKCSNEYLPDDLGADVGWEAVSGTRSSEGEVRSLGEPGVVVDRRDSLGNQISISSAGGSQKKRKAAVRE